MVSGRAPNLDLQAVAADLRTGLAEDDVDETLVRVGGSLESYGPKKAEVSAASGNVVTKGPEAQKVSSPDPSRTYHASQALELKDLLTVRFSGHRFGTNHPRVLHVSEPDGPSTDGGRKARQNIILSPEGGAEGGTVVIGWMDGSRKMAELKPYAMVTQPYQQRYHQPLDLTKMDYDHLIAEMTDFMKGQMIDVRMAAVTAQSRDRDHSRTSNPVVVKKQSAAWLPFALVAIGCLVAGFGIAWLVFKH